MVRAVLVPGLVAVSALFASGAMAKEVVVQMKDKGAAGVMVFEPAFVAAMPGDTIRFVPTNPSHNAETIPTMLPSNVAPSRGAIGKEFVLKVDQPGLYGIKCLPHFALGMVALVQVGKGPSPNLAAARAVKLPPLAAKRMTPMLAAAK